MAHLYTNFVGGTPNAGSVFEKTDAGALTQPVFEVPAFERRTVAINYKRSTYLVGTFKRMLVRDRFGAYHPAGVKAPQTKPTLADGAFGSGSEGNMIGYQTFVMKKGDVWLAESNPGPASDILVSAGTGRVWDSLDWTPADSHATHARGYVSVDGSFPALAWEQPISGSGTTVTENVGTAALGETLPVIKGVDNQYRPDIYGRGIPPYTRYAEEYRDAFFYAGDPIHPERIYISRLYEPEAVNTTVQKINGREEIPWLETTDGMPVTGIKRQGNELLVGTYRGIDRIQGYTFGDYAIHRVSNYWGVVSHFSMRRAGPRDSLYFMAPQGPTIYNSGSFRFIGEKIQSWWRDWFRSNPKLAEDIFTVEDRFWETVSFLLPQADDTSRYLVVDFNSTEYSSPVWVFDYRARKDWVSEELAVNSDANYYERFTGSCDGIVRQENVASNADDDGDAYQKTFVLQFPHRYMGDQSGDEAHGLDFHDLDLYVKHETNSITIQMYGGDDYAPGAFEPSWEMSSGPTSAQNGERPWTARTGEHQEPSGVSGRGVTLRLEIVAALDVECRGWGVEFEKGPAGQQPFSQ